MLRKDESAPRTTIENDRICVFINALSARRGGGQTYLVNLLRFMPPELGNIELFILAPRSLNTLLPSIKYTPVETKWFLENPFIRAFWERFILSRLLRRIGADILFCPGGVITTIPPNGCKTVTMFRNMIPFDSQVRKKYRFGYMRIRNWILKKLMLRSMIRADLLIFISQFAKSVIENLSKQSIKNAVVIPHGINPHFRAPSDNRLPRPGWLPKEGYFLYVSIFDVYKAQVEVVEAFALLKHRRKTREKLILAGPENRIYAKRLRKRIRDLNLEDDVILPGPISYSALPAVYHHATLNIFASECENCPNILLEALAAGRPLLSSDRPPMPEFGGDAVVYFDPAHPEQLASTILGIIDDPLKMHALAEKARIRSIEFQWDEVARKTWQAIVDLHVSSRTMP